MEINHEYSREVRDMYPNLDAEMARKRITRAFLAEEMGKTAITLSLKLNGKNIVNPECTVDYLFATEGDLEHS